jgi:hypothetical protein
VRILIFRGNDLESVIRKLRIRHLKFHHQLLGKMCASIEERLEDPYLTIRQRAESVRRWDALRKDIEGIERGMEYLERAGTNG